jgi:cytochrome c biogenesis protein CcdA
MNVRGYRRSRRAAEGLCGSIPNDLRTKFMATDQDKAAGPKMRVGSSDNLQANRPRLLRSIGLGLITAFLWTAPVTFPMMFAVVYLSAKFGQVTGQGIVCRNPEPLPALDSLPGPDRGARR